MPGQGTMYLGIQVNGGGWEGGVMETTGLDRGMGHCRKSTKSILVGSENASYIVS